MNTRLVLGGLKSFLPLSESRFKGTGGTDQTKYCYTIWLRHLCLIARFLGRPTFAPRTVIEIGPGDSIGTGIAALLSTADRYVGLDVIKHLSADRTVSMVDEMAKLYRRRAPIYDDTTFPRVYPRLSSYDFPAHLFDEKELEQRLSPASVDRVRSEIEHLTDAGDRSISYYSPWNRDSVPLESADLVFSQVALQDMRDSPQKGGLAANIDTMVSWLKAGGIMSHQIDFSCPGGTPWNHHWAYGDFTWRLICGRRPYYVNRVPLSVYVSLFKDAGCKILGIDPIAVHESLPRPAVAPRFRNLPDSDFRASGALVVAMKN